MTVRTINNTTIPTVVVTGIEITDMIVTTTATMDGGVMSVEPKLLTPNTAETVAMSPSSIHETAETEETAEMVGMVGIDATLITIIRTTRGEQNGDSQKR